MLFQGYRVAVVAALLVTGLSTGAWAEEPASVPAGTALDDLKCPGWKTVDLAPFYPAGMEKPFPVETEGLTLEQFLMEFQKATGVTIALDRQHLIESGVDANARLDKQLKGLPGSFALDHALLDFHGQDLRWVQQRGSYYVTTAEKAKNRLRLSTLEIGPLLDAGYTAETLQRLAIELSSGPWRETDGEGGSIRILGDRMNVLANDDCIREVQVLLAALASQEPVIALFHSPADEKVRDSLGQPVTIDIVESSLAKILNRLSQQMGIVIHLDQKELEDAGADLGMRISLTIHNQTLQQALDQLMEDAGGVQLKAVIRDGVLLVTTAERADEIEEVRIYDIPEIAERGDTQALINLIKEMTSGPWKQIDGDGGTIEALRPRTLLIRQTERGLQEIERLIAAHRGGKNRPKPAGDAVEIRHYRLPAQMAEDLLRLIPRFVAVDEWKEFPDGTSASIERVSLGSVQLAPALKKRNVPQPTAPDEGDETPLIVRTGDSVLLIRQTQSVHARIEQFIRDLLRTTSFQQQDRQPINAGPEAGGPGFF